MLILAREHAVADDARRDDPGDARGLPPDAREDDGAVAVDGRGRARRRDPAHREPRRRGRVGRRARPAVGGRGRSSSARPRTSRRASRRSAYLPAWYGSAGGRRRRRRRPGGWAPGLMSSSPIPNFGGMMAALGHDRELAVVVRVGRWRRVRRRRLGRRWRRRGRRLLSRPAASHATLEPWEQRTRWRCSSSASTRVTSRARSRSWTSGPRCGSTSATTRGPCAASSRSAAGSCAPTRASR